MMHERGRRKRGGERGVYDKYEDGIRGKGGWIGLEEVRR